VIYFLESFLVMWCGTISIKIVLLNEKFRFIILTDRTVRILKFGSL
jgi:hypothetical protein